jgi:hypothetical protein
MKIIVSGNICIQTIKGIKIIKYDRIFEIVYKMYMLRTYEVCKMIIYYFLILDTFWKVFVAYRKYQEGFLGLHPSTNDKRLY